MRVAVGTRITPRPPHRSRRALLTHRAPPSGRTSASKRCGLARNSAHSRQSNRRGISAQSPNHGRLSSGRTRSVTAPVHLVVQLLQLLFEVLSVGLRLFPLGEALPSTTSAGSCLPLFGRFLGTTASSDFSSAYMLGVRLWPSRAGPAQVRARVRPPRFRAKNFSTCTRSPTARGSSHASHSPWDDVAFSSAERDRHLGIRPVSQLNTWPVVSPVNASRFPREQNLVHHSGSGRLARPSPWGTFTSYSLPALPGAL